MRKQAEYNANEICKDYQKDILTIPKIANKHNISVQTVYDIIKRYNIPSKRQDNRKNIFNYNYFDKIDTKDKSYWLGWLYSDGCNYPPTGTFSIKLQEDDIDILYTLYQYISKDTPKISKIKKEKGKNQVAITFTSCYTSKKLEELGVVQAKTFKLKFPTEEQVPKHLQSHFIRGYFDGDGCLKNYMQNNDKFPSYYFVISGKFEFLEKLQQILIENCNIGKTKLVKNKSIFNLNYGGNRQIEKICSWLYQDCDNLYLKRKKQEYENLITLNKNKNRKYLKKKYEQIKK